MRKKHFSDSGNPRDVGAQRSFGAQKLPIRAVKFYLAGREKLLERPPSGEPPTLA